jgi:hypothetical protein
MRGPTNSKIRAAVFCRVEHDGRDGDSSDKTINGEAYDLKIRASTSRIARDGGIIEPYAWASDLEAYRRNPVIMFAHWYGDPPVGTAVHTEIDESDGSLVQYIKWLTGITDDQWDHLANRLRMLYQIGGMRTWSVGFNVKEFRDPTAEEKALAAQLGEEIYWVATRAELLETSAVPVPADKYAETIEKSFETARRKNLIDVAPLIRHWGEVKRIMGEGATCSECDNTVDADDIRRYDGSIVCVACLDEKQKGTEDETREEDTSSVDNKTGDSNAEGESQTNVTSEASNADADAGTIEDSAEGTGETASTDDTPSESAGEAATEGETPPVEQDTSTAPTDSTVGDAAAQDVATESSGEASTEGESATEGEAGQSATAEEGDNGAPPVDASAEDDDGEEYYEFEVEVPEGEDPEKAVIDQLVGEFVESLTAAVGQKSQQSE